MDATQSILTFMVLVVASLAIEPDPQGYVVYCPCMGRFGNQADQFLGALRFVSGLNRTMVLPPWVEYHPSERNSVQVPFDTYFKVAPLEEFHRMITMERFMKELAPTIWPPGKRISFCYTSRARNGNDEDCNAKDGNPFGPFWDTFNVNFDGSEFYGPLNYDTERQSTVQAWNKKFPAEKYPVLAFTGAPGAFPVREGDVELHKYLQWSDLIEGKAEEFISKNLPRPYLGIHLRHGVDFDRACEHAKDKNRHMFASAQCLGYRFEHGDMSMDLCSPPRDLVLAQILYTAKKIKAKSIFVATDSDPMIDTIKKRIKKLKGVTVVKYPGDSPHVDLAILGRSDHYICNCVSTFSAFAARERKATNKPTSFWAFNFKMPKLNHDEF